MISKNTDSLIYSFQFGHHVERDKQKHILRANVEIPTCVVNSVPLIGKKSLFFLTFFS